MVNLKCNILFVICLFVCYTANSQSIFDNDTVSFAEVLTDNGKYYLNWPKGIGCHFVQRSHKRDTVSCDTIKKVMTIYRHDGKAYCYQQLNVDYPDFNYESIPAPKISEIIDGRKIYFGDYAPFTTFIRNKFICYKFTNTSDKYYFGSREMKIKRYAKLERDKPLRIKTNSPFLIHQISRGGQDDSAIIIYQKDTAISYHGKVVDCFLFKFVNYADTRLEWCNISEGIFCIEKQSLLPVFTRYSYNTPDYDPGSKKISMKVLYDFIIFPQ